MSDRLLTSDPQTIVEALTHIRAGGVIAIPIENSYVFAADAFNRSAVESLHLIRDDPEDQAASVMVPSITSVRGLTASLSEEALLLAENFWPGKLFLQLKANRSLTWDLGDGGSLNQFMVRVPNNEFALALLKETGPLAVANAGLSGRPALREPGEINEVFGSVVHLMCDHGALDLALGSTVVDATDIPHRIVREGEVTNTQLRALCPALV